MHTGTRSSWLDLVPTCLNRLQPLRYMRLQSTKCLVRNSIIDGLKSRLMQYLAVTLTARWFVLEKHVVEDDVLFTKVISKFEPVTLVWVNLTKLKLSLKTGIKIPIFTVLLIIIFQQFQVVQLMDVIPPFHLIC